MTSTTWRWLNFLCCYLRSDIFVSGVPLMVGIKSFAGRTVISRFNNIVLDMHDTAFEASSMVANVTMPHPFERLRSFPVLWSTKIRANSTVPTDSKCSFSCVHFRYHVRFETKTVRCVRSLFLCARSCCSSSMFMGLVVIDVEKGWVRERVFLLPKTELRRDIDRQNGLHKWYMLIAMGKRQLCPYPTNVRWDWLARGHSWGVGINLSTLTLDDPESTNTRVRVIISVEKVLVRVYFNQVEYNYPNPMSCFPAGETERARESSIRFSSAPRIAPLIAHTSLDRSTTLPWVSIHNWMNIRHPWRSVRVKLFSAFFRTPNWLFKVVVRVLKILRSVTTGICWAEILRTA